MMKQVGEGVVVTGGKYPDKNAIKMTALDMAQMGNVTAIMARNDKGQARSGKIGECNFYEETQEKALLFDYVMYARAGEIPQFWQNYREEIISLQIDRKVDGYAADQQ